LVVNGAVKASISNTKTRADQPTELNFALKSTSASQVSNSAKKGKHLVWAPPPTGSHMSGSWVEIDDIGISASAAGTLNVERVSGVQLERQGLRSADGSTGH
jgi:hypothetical protein